jgi:peptidoglycan/xylan/chitin deacetylase (PgdA/CDA1 family)
LTARTFARDSLIRATYATGAPYLRKRVLRLSRGPLSRVLCFHRVRSAAEFREKAEFLARHFNVVTLSDIEDGANLSRSRTNLAITFDDGFAEQIENALPALVELELPATFFLITGCLGLSAARAERFYADNVGIAYDRALGQAEVGELARQPKVEIGLHTRTHADLGGAEDPQTLVSEIAEAREEMERICGRPVLRLAYPYGGILNYSRIAIEYARAAGLRSAYTIIPGFNTSVTPRYEMHRDSLSPSLGPTLFKAWLAGSYDPFKSVLNSVKMGLGRHTGN